MYWHVIPSLQSAILHTSFRLNKTSDLDEHTSNTTGSVRLSNITNLYISRITICIGSVNKTIYISSHGTNGKIKSIQSFVISKPKLYDDSTIIFYVTISFIITGFWEGIEIASLNVNQQIEYSAITAKKDLSIECKSCNSEVAVLINPIVIQLPLNNNLNDIFCSECEVDLPNLIEKKPNLNEIFLDTDNYLININNLTLNSNFNPDCENCSKLYQKYQSTVSIPTVVDSEHNQSLSPRNLKIEKIKLYKGDFGYIGDTFGYYKYRQEFLSPLMPINHLLKLSIIQSDVPYTKESISIIVTSRDIYLLPIFVSSNPIISYFTSNSENSISTENITIDEKIDILEEEVIAQAKDLFDSVAPVIGKRVLWKQSDFPETSTAIALSTTSYNYLLESLVKYTLSNPENKQSDLKISAIPI